MKIKINIEFDIGLKHPLFKWLHLKWMDFWSSRKVYSIYGPQHLDFALKRADIEKELWK